MKMLLFGGKRTILIDEECDCMFYVWIGDIEFIKAVLVLSGVVLLLIQLLLCFKVKNKVIRLLPAILLSIFTIFFVAMASTATDWENLGYIFPAIFIGFMWFMCGMAWGIWAIIKLIKKKKDNESNLLNR